MLTGTDLVYNSSEIHFEYLRKHEECLIYVANKVCFGVCFNVCYELCPPQLNYLMPFSFHQVCTSGYRDQGLLLHSMLLSNGSIRGITHMKSHKRCLDSHDTFFHLKPAV